MKRAANRGRTPESAGEQGFWPSYADMMSALALILFFLMLLSYIQNLITGNDLQSTKKLLDSTKEELALTLSEMEDAEAALKSVTDDLDIAQSKLQLQQKEIAGYTEKIAGYAAKIDEQTETITAQEKLIGDQASYLRDANEEIVAMRNQMQTIAVLRLSILEQIRESIAQVMGDASKVSIGENGNIILSEGILFDLGSAEVKPGSQKVLNELIDVFDQFLSDEENARYVDSIVISGHTDSTGTDEVNRKLSTDRANAVLNYLLTGRSAALRDEAEYFCAAGYGATRPVQSNDTEAGRSANRRIEISMILRDETVLDIVEQYLALDLPEEPEASSGSEINP